MLRCTEGLAAPCRRNFRPRLARVLLVYKSNPRGASGGSFQQQGMLDYRVERQVLPLVAGVKPHIFSTLLNVFVLTLPHPFSTAATTSQLFTILLKASQLFSVLLIIHYSSQQLSFFHLFPPQLNSFHLCPPLLNSLQLFSPLAASSQLFPPLPTSAQLIPPLSQLISTLLTSVSTLLNSSHFPPPFTENFTQRNFYTQKLLH